MTRPIVRTTLVGLTTLLFSGCQIGRDINNSWQQINDIAKYIVAPTSGSSVSADEVEAIPFATLGVRTHNSKQSIFTLSQNQGDRRFWISGDRYSIVTQNGRLVRTSGFSSDLTGSVATTQDPLAISHISDWTVSSHSRILDFQDDFGYGHRMECKLKDLGHERISVLGRFVSTRKLGEDCGVPTLDWSFENTHWIDDKTGFLWRTHQWISPSHKKPIELEVLRPAA